MSAPRLVGAPPVLIAMIAYAINERMARRVDYLQEDVRVLKEVLAAATGKTRLDLSAEQPCRLSLVFEWKRSAVCVGFQPRSARALPIRIRSPFRGVGLDEPRVRADRAVALSHDSFPGARAYDGVGLVAPRRASRPPPPEHFANRSPLRRRGHRQPWP
jgi:hypothetical protein